MDASRQVSGAYTAVVLDAGPDDPVPWPASEFLLGWTAIDTDRPELHWPVDTWSPGSSSLETGMTLCLYTDHAQVVPAEVTSVDPETESSWTAVNLDVSVWSWY